MADEINTDENSFALINDITSILGVGDLLIAQNGMRELVEVKEGKINALIAKLFEENKQDDPAAIDELSKIHGPYIADQIKRFGKQKQTMDAVIDYIKTGTGKDLIYGVYKNKYEVKTPTDGFNKLVHAAIDRFYVDRRSLLVPLDCCWVGIFDKTGISEQVRIWDFMHYLYHTLTKPWDQCDYLKPKEQQNFTKNNPPEFFVYSITPIYLIKNKVRTFSHQPLFLTLKSKYAIDLMVDKFGLYVYFDVDNFAALSAQQGLQIRWLTQSQMDKFNSGERIRNLVLPRFNGRYLQLEYNNNSCVFSYGHLYRLIYEFQSGYSLVEQIKEFLAAELFAKGLESFPLSPKSKQYESK
ncbi:MAG: hypothetical protein HY033_13985 [Ignavibacteriae bacterium]|nr:hypothetical protein [Ignavibacteriota bacterium]